MSEREFDSRIVFRGLMAGELSPAQAAALFRQNRESARYYLNDCLNDVLNAPAYKDNSDLGCAAGRFLEMYWLTFGPSGSALMLTIHKGPLVDRFFREKLNASLNEFSDDDMSLLEQRYWD